MKFPVTLTPNYLTVARILFIPLGVYTLFKNGGDDATWRYISWGIFFTLGFTDILDGKWARSSNRVTELGKFLDPVADKALIGTALISLSILGRLPWWITIVILVREIGITFFRIAVIKRGVIPANRGGKIKVLFQGFGTGFYILPLPHNLFLVRDGFMYIVVFLTIVTGIYYVRSARTKVS